MFSIDLTSRTPIYEQIYENIIGLVVKGRLAENDQLPSVRAFAKDAGVNPNTVAKAYQELERTGIIYSVPGRGSFIAKPDSAVFQGAVLADFDSAVLACADRGIDKQVLTEHLDNIYTKHGKGEQL
ncbi:GntR family transcriptional regulator [Ruminococcus sp. YRD2003]|uniref:GntR family transcriptional regulator n=1 Tax=Ruminococcus sp. YRD2003 TaxID=1452313 RepID=UPI0008B0BEA0|nr:GntR family transcriptional regulator [Ruminococcus sp.]SEK98937.1 GntR family transcriptional regulator [Ruminococcus flavefaciens]